MDAVPAKSVVTIPDELPTVAIVGDPDVHVPPVGVPVSVTVAPAHAVSVPDMVCAIAAILRQQIKSTRDIFFITVMVCNLTTGLFP